MNSRERVLAHLAGRPVDRLPLTPITMQFACDRIGARYRDYEVDHRVLVEGQLRVAEEFGFDYVNTMSDPAREAADCGATVEYFENSPAAMVEERALLGDKAGLVRLKIPDPLGGGRMHNGVKALSLFKERLKGEKIIEGWIEGPCAEAADLRGINTLMLDFYTRFILGGMGRLGCAIVDLDSLASLDQGRARMGPGQVLLGNLNPVTVLRGGTKEDVLRGVAACHREAGQRFIVGAGCEVPRDTPHESVRALAEYARSVPP